MMTAVGTTSDVQAMIDAMPAEGGYVRVPPGEYTGGSVSIVGKRSDNGPRAVIDMDGVWFSGEGYYLTIDSCKRLTIRGLRAQGFDMLIKGMWWSSIENVEVASHVYCGPGTTFSSAYWNSFIGGQIQRMIFHETLADPANANFYYNTTIHSAAGQGYVNNRDYSIEFRANKNVKGLRFYGGDISYGAILDWKIGTNNTTGQIDCIGNGIYFDSGRDLQTLNQASPKRLIKWVDQYHW